MGRPDHPEALCAQTSHPEALWAEVIILRLCVHEPGKPSTSSCGLVGHDHPEALCKDVIALRLCGRM